VARIVSVVLGDGSEAARDADTLALLRYGLSFYRRVTSVRAGETFAHAQVKYFGDRETTLVAGRPVGLTVRRGERVRTVVDAPGKVTGPLDRGARVGTVRVFRAGQLARSVPLVTAEAVPAAGFLRKAWRLAIPILLISAGVALALAVRRRRRTAAPPVGRPASAE
jgi:serine-type D-Ala-D-Ala carboxypeptidase (penicillin-binding protein 5/6)